MASSLKSRLSAISSNSGSPKKPPVLLSDMTYVEHAQVADERLYSISPLALKRIGFDAEWPGIERVLFLDTETTGLSRGAGTVAFIVGVGYVQHGAFIVEQRMIGDYPDEPIMISELMNLIRRFDAVATFNGNNFDIPLLESRAVMCRLPELFSGMAKLDLMHPSRRLWKRRIGSCRLSALEEQILSSGRENDLPGSEAPKRFFEYLQTGNLRLLDEVLLHNRLDILSLGALLIKLCECYDQPEQLLELPDLFSMARAMERLGDSDLAESLYGIASKPRAATSISGLRYEEYSNEARFQISLYRKRAGELDEAERIWSAMARRGQLGARPHIELAKLYEHRLRDMSRAIEMALGALEIENDASKRAPIERRIERLRQKINREV